MSIAMALATFVAGLILGLAIGAAKTREPRVEAEK